MILLLAITGFLTPAGVYRRVPRVSGASAAQRGHNGFFSHKTGLRACVWYAVNHLLVLLCGVTRTLIFVNFLFAQEERTTTCLCSMFGALQQRAQVGWTACAWRSWRRRVGLSPIRTTCALLATRSPLASDSVCALALPAQLSQLLQIHTSITAIILHTVRTNA